MPAGAEADVKQGDALDLPVPRRRVRPRHHLRGARAHPRRRARDRRAGPGAAARRHDRRHRAALAAGEGLLGAVRRVPRGRGRPRPHLHAADELRRQARERPACGTSARDHAHGLHSPYWWLKCAVGVDNDKNPLVKAYPPAAGLGHHEAAAGHPARRAGAQPADRQERGALPREARRVADRCRVGRGHPGGAWRPPRAAGRRDRRRDRPSSSRPTAAIPWAVGEHIDPWNHVEAAMALLVGGEVEAAEAAYDWCLATQHADGSWPMKIIGDRGRGRQRRDQHVGLPRGRRLAPLAASAGTEAFVRRCGRRCAAASTSWPACSCRRRHRLVAAGRRQGQRPTRCSPAARASTTRCGPASRSPSWSRSRSRTGSWRPAGCGTRWRRTATCSSTRPTFSMDWYYPVLGGPLRGARGAPAARRAAGTTSSSPGSACRCVDTNPWVTGAETCELVLALDASATASGRSEIFADMQHLRHTRRAVLDRLRLRRGRLLAARADDVHLGRGRSSPPTRCPARRRARASSAATGCRADLPPIALQCGCELRRQRQRR